MSDKQSKLDILRKINNNPKTSQRELANQLGFSLGKLNYLMGALLEKGLIKIKNFQKILGNLIIYTYSLKRA